MRIYFLQPQVCRHFVNLTLILVVLVSCNITSSLTFPREMSTDAYLLQVNHPQQNKEVTPLKSSSVNQFVY